jgi:glycosyltransferase involved in cell wall biosynthesis
MKFLFLSSHAHYALDPASTRVSGGAELQVALLARELASTGRQAVIVGGDTGQDDVRVLQGVKNVNGGRFHTGFFGDTLQSIPRILGILHSEKPDYLVIFGWTALLWIYAMIRPLFGYRLVFICGLDTEIDGSFGRDRGWKGRLFERGVRLADRRYAMTRLQEAHYDRLGFSHAPYRSLVVSRGKMADPKKDIDLLWIGRCQRVKRPLLFLEIARRLPEMCCTMICSREDIPLWEQVAREAATIPNLDFIESVPYHSVHDYYDRSKLLVSTSEAEGVPNVMIQAAQGGAGIFSLDVDPNGMIARYGAGLCANGDFNVLCVELKRVIADPNALSVIAAGASVMVDEWLDNSKNMDLFLAGLS